MKRLLLKGKVIKRQIKRFNREFMMEATSSGRRHRAFVLHLIDRPFVE